MSECFCRYEQHRFLVGNREKMAQSVERANVMANADRIQESWGILEQGNIVLLCITDTLLAETALWEHGEDAGEDEEGVEEAEEEMDEGYGGHRGEEDD